MTSKKTYLRDGRAPIPKSEVTSRVMSANKGRNTKPERLLQKTLRRARLIGFRTHYKSMHGRPDIAFPRKKLAIFVHGCFWHRCPHCKLPFPKRNTKFWKVKFTKNVIRDAQKLLALKGAGWKAIVIWECQIKKDTEWCLAKIKRNYKND